MSTHVTHMSKKMENVEYLIKLEQKNKKQLDEKYDKMITKIDSQLEKLENELEKTIRELNEKEAKIFDIQKSKLENFKKEILKYEHIYNEIDEKSQNLSKIINENTNNEMENYNRTFMVYEDLASLSSEIEILTKNVTVTKENMTDIEKTYPKEFKFLLEDIEFEKELNEITTRKSIIKKDLEVLLKNKRTVQLTQETKMAEIKANNEEIKKIEILIQTGKSESGVIKLEGLITSNVTDILVFEKIKTITQNYYSQKNFDLENEVNVILIRNLGEKLKEMKNEFVLLKNEKLLIKTKKEKKLAELQNVLNGLSSSSNNKPPGSLLKEITATEIEINEVSNEINMLELNCKKKETLLNKYIFVIRNKCKKSSQESYYEMNPAIVIETEFDERLKEEILNQIEQESKSEEDKYKNRNLVEIYFKELNLREKSIQNLSTGKKKIEEASDILQRDIEKLSENFTQLELEINTKNLTYTSLQSREKILYEKIEQRNRNLTINLEQISEMDFEKYLHSNESVLKNMKKIYGNKVIDKVFKVQKQKFLEGVVMDHSYKKTKVNEYIRTIAKNEQYLDYYTSSVHQLEQNYHAMFSKYLSVIELNLIKKNENKILQESKAELKNKMEFILKEQLAEIEIEKKQLQFKFNVTFLVDKIKEINFRLENVLKEREKTCQEYEEFNHLILEKEHRLYKEDLDLKNNLVSHEPSRTIMPYKVYKNHNEDHSDMEFKPNLEDTAKKSLIEFTSQSEDNNEHKNNFENINFDQSVNSYRTMYSNMLKDPLLQNAIEKIKPLLEGISLYKRFGNSSLCNKVFDPSLQPENCGYAIRTFKINCNDEVIEIRKNKHVEHRFGISQLKGLMLSNSSKQLVKSKKSIVSKPNVEVGKLLNNDYIQFTILILDGNIDVIAPSYQIYGTFETALNELIAHKKNIYPVLKKYETSLI